MSPIDEPLWLVNMLLMLKNMPKMNADTDTLNENEFRSIQNA